MLGDSVLLLVGFIFMFVFCLTPVILSLNPPPDPGEEPQSWEVEDYVAYKVFEEFEADPVEDPNEPSIDTSQLRAAELNPQT